MEIGEPTDVRHVAHVTFDRFHGFLGLPVEFEPEVPSRAPSASATVFGVSTESMQCSYDSRGNSVPTILLLMQRRLYEREGLQAEGIFRINGDNSQEEYVRDQLNSGIVPDEIDVHCLAGLIKAWFRELPTGVLDPLTPDQVMQCQSEEECAQVVKLLPPTEAALLDWAINFMADVVQEEHKNKMNVRNIAMVFAPNMTQIVDPLNALMYAVQVMNFLKMLILRTLKLRQESTLEDASISHSDPSEENNHRSAQLPLELSRKEFTEQAFVQEGPKQENSDTDEATTSSSQNSYQRAIREGGTCSSDEDLCRIPPQIDGPTGREENSVNPSAKEEPDNLYQKERRKTPQAEKSKETNIITCINSESERI